jgi:methylmalonyl-CoA/ethylmalonyl-CoA epimerase
MNLRFSHVDILVSHLQKTVDYHKQLLDGVASEVQVWKNGDFHVEFQVLFHSDRERIFFVHPISGNLKTLLEEKGNGTIYRLCYVSPDVTNCHYQFLSKGIQPENENGNPIHLDDLNKLNKTNILWLPKQHASSLSIEVLEEETFEKKLSALRAKAT